MAINFITQGQTGTHAFTKTNINEEENFIYFKTNFGEVIPSELSVGTTFIYTPGVGSIGGLSGGDLVYVTTENPKKLTFSTTADGSPISFTGATAGQIALNKPVVYLSKLNIDASTPSNQAVKYYTDGQPMTGLTSGNTYFLKNVSISEFAGSQALYQFTSHNFTTAGSTGRVGPTIQTLRTEYNTTQGANWVASYLNQGNFRGYQDWTVPVSGVYEFNLQGAGGGLSPNGNGSAGRGAVIQGRVSLTKGEIITIAVGQRGEDSTNTSGAAGGGGGTFVVRKAGNQPLFVAGGGAGEPDDGAGIDANLGQLGARSTNGSTAGTTAGGGGLSSGGFSAGGGGFLEDGQDAFRGINGGHSFTNGLSHDNFTSLNGGFGGFGGGAQADGNYRAQSGGGGGYSGGAGSRSTTRDHSGGGGGCFIIETATEVGTSDGTFDGVTTLSGNPITDLSSFNSGEGSVSVSLVSDFTTGNEVYPTALDAENGTNQIGITSAGSSFHSFVPISLDIQNNVIHSPTPHTLTDNTAVIYDFNQTAPAGLVGGQVYYVETVDTFTYKLAANPDLSAPLSFTTPSAVTQGAPDSVSRVVVNVDTDALTISNHGFQVNQPIQYDTGGGTAIAPLIDQATYYVSEVLDANRIRLKTELPATQSIDFTSPGTGTAHSFIFKTVNDLEDTLYIPNHGLVDGQTVVYQDNGNTPIPGLGNGSTYYVEAVNESTIRLYDDPAKLQEDNAGQPEDIQGVGTGTHSLVITSLDFVNNIIIIPDHGFGEKELVEYDSGGQTEVAGLISGTPYYVKVVGANSIRLATTPDNVDAGIFVQLEETPAGVGRHSLKSLTETPDGIYEIDSIPSANTFSVKAAGAVDQIVKRFNPRSSVDLNLNAFKIDDHGFNTGAEVTYSNGDPGTPISGLADNTVYYVVAINQDYIRLATSPENSASGVTLSVSDFGTGVAHSFTTNQIDGNVTGAGSVSVAAGSVLVDGVGTQFAKILKVGDVFRLYPPNDDAVAIFTDADVNDEINRITVSSAPDWNTGDTVRFAAGGGVPPAPLVDGYYYFVRLIDETTVTLHNSAADASNNTGALDISTTGTGSEFSLTRTNAVGPIIRRITAVGSDTQITVDRPYANSYLNVGYSYPTFIYVRPQGYSLHRPFDGGVEMSVGANTSLGQIIRQTRKYFRYQSGKGIQTSCGINFKPSIDIESMTKFSEIQIQCTTRRPHGLQSGLFVVISQAETSDGSLSEVYNGRFQVAVDSLTAFRITTDKDISESKAFGFPQFHVEEWRNGAIRSGMFDFQNGAFYEFDGQKLYAVRRSSTQQLAGTAACLQGSEDVFGTNTKFSAQLKTGDMIVMRGQSYRVVEIQSDTRLSIRPEYKGSSGTEKEFDPGNGVDGVVKLSDDRLNILNHGFADGIPVIYNSIDGEALGGLVNGRTYYVSLIDNNNFKLKATPETNTVVNISSVGTTNVHSFTPAKSGIIITKTVDTRIPQEEWSVDPCDGTGPTGYNLDISRIQMAYIDYSWYGAGKIRFGFKTNDGQVQYTHEFVHNNILYESYFRSGNLPARYEVVTDNEPTYIPFLFHWGTSVMMDGEFDDDNAYLFTANSQALAVEGTTEKSFSSDAIDVASDSISLPSHGFQTENAIQFEGISTDGLRGQDSQNPEIVITRAGNPLTSRLANTGTYYAQVEDPDTIHLFPPIDGAGAAPLVNGQVINNSAQTGTTVTVVTAAAHNLTNGDVVHITGLSRVPNGVVTVSNVAASSFDYTVTTSATVSAGADSGRIDELIQFVNQGNPQYTFFLYPQGALNNTSGPNYQPLLSLRLSPSVSEGLTGSLGDRDVLNRMQLRLQEVGVSTNSLVDVKLLLNPRLNNLNFKSVDSPSLTQVVEHTASDTVSGGVQVYNFSAQGGAGGVEEDTTVDVSTLFELSNSILGGDSIFPDGPDILTIAVSRLTGNETLSSARMSWAEAQA